MSGQMRMEIAVLMKAYEPGSGLSWVEEARDLWDRDADQMTKLVRSVSTFGVLLPVLLGDDGRLWDGHHRLPAAHAALLTWVPIEYAA